MTAGGSSLYFVTDHLRSTRALADVSGNVVEQLSYDSFGNSSGSSFTRYSYTSREQDPVTGQSYYRARFYEAQFGRFTSEDPIGFRGGKNWYEYVGDSPIIRFFILLSLISALAGYWLARSQNV